METNSVSLKGVRPSAAVVGGSSGIGYETCIRLVNRGWSVTNISRSACNNAKVNNICADVSCGSEVNDAIAKVADRYGLNALVYCAGFSMAAPIEYAKESDYKYLFEVNFFGALRAMQTAIQFMKKKGGKIVLVGSLGGDLPIIFDSFYSCSKAALEMLAREANTELNRYNISVTAVLPGGTATNFTYKRKVYPEEENGSYARSLNKAVAALANMEQSGMKPSRVAEDIYKILIAEKPPIIKTCGVMNNAKRFASRVMPEKLTTYVNGRMYNQ
ncbi:MAG: SDR family NAD(P)-dependent oxidoreductase [Clostridia bacterium]|nr:SDR family NAD(P)-dependent oxidoreductase [Clostridia bacterium]